MQKWWEPSKKKFYPYGDAFRWTLNWDPDEFATPADTAAIIGLRSRSSPGPVINNNGDIAARIFWAERKNRGSSISLLPSGKTEWTRLIKKEPWRIALNDQNQIACTTTPFDGDFNYGSVIVGGTVWALDNKEIIVDPENQWFTDNATPEAVADASSSSVLGFSMVVGWHYNGQAFVLIPLEP